MIYFGLLFQRHRVHHSGGSLEKIKGRMVAGTALADHIFIYSQDIEIMGSGGEAIKP